MANTIKIKRSGTSGDSPTSGELQHGELGINYADGKLFFKNSSNAIQELLTSPGTSNGQLLFANSSSNFEGSSDLFWDNTNKRLGIGETSPTTPLHVVGAIKASGTTDIVLNPVNGSMIFGSRTILRLLGDDLQVGNTSGLNDINFYTDGSQRMTIGGGNNAPIGVVGIGTASPSADYTLTLQQPTGTNKDYIQGIQDNGSNTAFRINTDSGDNVALRLFNGSGQEKIYFNVGGHSRIGNSANTNTLTFDSANASLYSSATGLYLGVDSGNTNLIITKSGTSTPKLSAQAGGIIEFASVIKTNDVQFHWSSNDGRANFYDSSALMGFIGTDGASGTALRIMAQNNKQLWLYNNDNKGITISDGSTPDITLDGKALISGATVGDGNAVLSVKQTNAYASPHTQHIMELKNTSNDVKFRVRTDGQVFFNSFQPISGNAVTMYAGNSQTHAKVDSNLFTWMHSSTEHMRLDTSTGRLGVGTASPTAKLQVSPDNNDLTSNAALGLWVQGSNGGIKIGRHDGNDGAFTHIYTDVASTDFAYIVTNDRTSGGIATDRIAGADQNPVNNYIELKGYDKIFSRLGTTQMTHDGNGVTVSAFLNIPLNASNTSHKIKLTADSAAEIYAKNYGDLFFGGGGKNYSLSTNGTYASTSDNARQIYLKHESSTSAQLISSNMSNFSIYSGTGGHFGFNTIGSSYTYNAITNVHTDNNTSGLKLNARTGGNDVTAMTILSDGNIGIGTVTPAHPFEIHEAGTMAFFDHDRTGFATQNAGESPRKAFLRSRGSNASPSVITSGDVLGEITFAGYVSSGYFKSSAKLRVGSDETIGNHSVPSYFAFLTTTEAGTSEVERMRIAHDGKIGIGTASPAHQLDIQGVGITEARVKSTSHSGGSGRAKLHLDAKSDIAEIYFALDGTMKSAIYQKNDGTTLNVWSGANSSEVMTWDVANNRVGIGTVSPERKLDVAGNMRITDTATTGSAFYAYTNAIHTGTGGSSIMTVESDNTSATGTALDIRMDGTGDFINLRRNNGADKCFVVKSDGKVSINMGSVNPTYQLDIIHAGDNQFRVGRSSAKNVAIRDDVMLFTGMTGNGMRIQTSDNSHIKFSSGTGKTIFDYAGAGGDVAILSKLGIGTDSPVDKLQITSPNYDSSTVDPDYFKALKLQIEEGQYWAQQAQFKLGRWENVNGSHSRSSLVIGLAHGAVAESADADVDVLELRSDGKAIFSGTVDAPAYHIGSDPYHGQIKSTGGGNVEFHPRASFDINFVMGTNNAFTISKTSLADGQVDIGGTTKDLGGVTSRIYGDGEVNFVLDGFHTSTQWWATRNGGTNEKLMTTELTNDQKMSWKAWNDNATIKYDDILVLDGGTGLVGIGTDSPVSGWLLTVGDTGTQVKIKDSHIQMGGGGFDLVSGSAQDTFIQTHSGWTSDIVLKPGGTEAMRLEYDTQRVGIGTASPVNLLHVAGNISATGGDIILDNNKFYKGKWTGGASYNLIGMNNHNWVVVGASGFGLKSGTGNFVVDGGDNVGIGTASVSNRLTVKGTDTSSGTFDFEIQNSNAGSIFKVNNEGSLNVGSGTYSSAYKAMVHGSLFANGMKVLQNQFTYGYGYGFGNGYSRICGSESEGMKFYVRDIQMLSVEEATNLGVMGTARRTIGSATSSGTGNRTITESSHGMLKGDAVRIPSGNSSADEIFTIASVTDANVFVVDSDLTNAISSATIYKDGDLFKLNNADATTKVIVNKTGRMGVGTATPYSTFAVNQGANYGDDSAITIGATGLNDVSLYLAGGNQFYLKNYTTQIRMDRASDIMFQTNNVERMRITAAGRVAIGNFTDPNSTLEVYNTIGTSNWIIKASDSSGNDLGGFYENSNGHAQIYAYNGSNVEKICLSSDGNSHLSGGNVGIGVTPAHKFHVEGASRLNGDVGIGIAPNSTDKLDVYGKINAHSDIKAPRFTSNSVLTNTIIKASNTGLGINIQNAAGDNLAFFDGATNAIKVGINTGSPLAGSRLDVVNVAAAGNEATGVGAIRIQDYNVNVRNNAHGGLEFKQASNQGYKLGANAGDNTFSFLARSGSASWSETMTFSQDKVGIGQTAPAYALDVIHKGSGTLRLTGASSKAAGTNTYAYFKTTDASDEMCLMIKSTTNSYFEFQAMEQNIAYRDIVFNRYGGKIGIGITTPATTLHTYGGTGLRLESNHQSATPAIQFKSPAGSSNGGDAGGQFNVLDSTGSPRIQHTMRRVSSAANGDTVGDYPYEWWSSDADGGLNFRMKLNRKGLGIGTQNPRHKLEVNGSGHFGSNVIVGDSYGAKGIFGANADLNSDPGFMHFSCSNVNTTNSSYIKVASGNTGDNSTKGHIDLVAGYYSGSSMTGDIRFWTGDSGNQRRMTIDNTGKIGIGMGNTLASELLQVQGHLAVTEGSKIHVRRDGGSLKFTANALSSGSNYGEFYMSSDTIMNWTIGGTERMNLGVNGVTVSNIYTPSVVAGGGNNLNIMASGTELILAADYDSTGGEVKVIPTGKLVSGETTVTFNKDYTYFHDKFIRFNSNGVSDPSAATNSAHMYAKDVSSSAEMFVQDEAGNVTQISPHDENGEWVFNSKNIKTKIRKRIRMEKLIRRLEEHFGEEFIEEFLEPA